MKLNEVLFYNDIPIKYYYCSTGEKEYILNGLENGYISAYNSSNSAGSIVISILEVHKKIFEIIENYIKIIENENYSSDEESNQFIVWSHLTKLQGELSKINFDIFNCLDFPKNISNKFIEKILEIHIEKEKYNAKNDSFQKLKKLLNVDEFPDNKKALEILSIENNNLKQKIETLENLSFKNFTLEYLNNLLLDFNSSIFNFVLYFEECDNLEVNYDNKKINLDNELERKLLLLTNYNNISTDKNISWTKMAIIKDNKFYLEKFDKIKDYSIENFKMLHFFEFNTVVDLFNLSLINAIDKQVTIRRCKNCGNYFIPENRTDEVYCNRISPQNNKKTCKEYGAKKKYRDEVKSRPLKNEHNKTMQFFRMRINRAKNEKEKEKLIKKFEKYKIDYQKNKERYNNGNGKLKENDFIEWIINQKNLDR